MAGTTRLGTPAGLQLGIEILPPSAQHQSGLAWAALQVSAGGQIVWGDERTTKETPTLEWTLVDLLHGLARIWPWLMFEEGYPIPLSPEYPDQLMDKARERWDEMPPAEAEAEEDLLYDFRQRHDLSLLLRGVQLAPLWLLREGRDCLVSSPVLRAGLRLAHDEVMQTLAQVGDFLHEALRSSPHPRAQTAMARWRDRWQATRQHYFCIASGLNRDELRVLAGAHTDDLAAPAAFFELDDNADALAEPNELLMAARMTHGYMSLHDQRTLLQLIKSAPPASAAKIDALSASAPPLDSALTAYEQAYVLADWLRRTLEIAPAEPIFPERLLASWAIPVTDFDIPAPIDAAAVWGARRGPCILLNRNASSRASSDNGYRTTLAHEICHLLVDRKRALPVAEVLGGQVARRAEQRANAFAAELLLPRAQAAQVCEAHADLLDAAAFLEKRYRVSREVVTNQINNSDFGARLDHAARRRLNDWKMETRAVRKNTA